MGYGSRIATANREDPQPDPLGATEDIVGRCATGSVVLVVSLSAECRSASVKQDGSAHVVKAAQVSVGLRTAAAVAWTVVHCLA